MESISDYIPAYDWVESGRSGVVNSRLKFDHVVRHFGKDLEDSGQFIRGGGRRPHLVGPKIGEVILQIYRKTARERS